MPAGNNGLDQCVRCLCKHKIRGKGEIHHDVCGVWKNGGDNRPNIAAAAGPGWREQVGSFGRRRRGVDWCGLARGG